MSYPFWPEAEKPGLDIILAQRSAGDSLLSELPKGQLEAWAVDLVKPLGLTGSLRFGGSLHHSGNVDRRVKLLIIYQDRPAKEVELRLPESDYAVYVEVGGEWKLQPSDAPLSKKYVRLRPSDAPDGGLKILIDGR